MSPKVVGLLAMLLAGSGLWWWGAQPSTPPALAPVAQAFPTLPQLAAVREPGVLLTTWASWCAVCMAELPRKIAYAQAHPRLALVAVNIDTNPAQRRAALQRLNAPALPNIYWLDDPSRTLAFGTLQGSGVPESFILNAQRQLLLKQSGPVALDYGPFAAALAAAQR